MSEKKIAKPIALAVGAALASSFAISGTASADSIESPFALSSLNAGYMLVNGEGSCRACRLIQEPFAGPLVKAVGPFILKGVQG